MLNKITKKLQTLDYAHFDPMLTEMSPSDTVLRRLSMGRVNMKHNNLDAFV